MLTPVYIEGITLHNSLDLLLIPPGDRTSRSKFFDLLKSTQVIGIFCTCDAEPSEP